MSEITDKLSNSNVKQENKIKEKKKIYVEYEPCDSHVFDWNVSGDAPYSEHLCE